MAIPKPEPKDWQVTNAQQLRLGDAEVLRMLRDAFNRVNKSLRELPADKDVTRAQLERTRQLLLAEQAKVFEKLGDITSARRLRAASRAAKLSAASEAALLRAAGATSTADDLYRSLLATSQAGIQAAMTRMGLSALPLSQRIYNVQTWMDGRLNRLINATLATTLNARKFAAVARDWFNPNTPGGVRYAALRLARTEINNAFHSMTVARAVDSPWTPNMSWHLSKSHPKKDECNVIAEHDAGEGAGVYRSEAVPVRPHPQCMCYVVPEPIEEDEFIENFLKGDYDDYLDEKLAEQDRRLAAERPEPPDGQANTTVTPIRPEVKAPAVSVAPVAPKVLPERDTEGYQPGNWVQEFGNEREIRTIMASIDANVPDEKRAAQEAEKGPGWIRQLAEQLVGGLEDDGTVTYSNGPHQVLFAGKLARERHAEFLGYVDRLQDNFPTGRHMRIRVAASSEFGQGVGGETTLGTGSMYINENVLERDTWGGMPVSNNVSSGLYVLAHEWGHSLSTVDEAREKHVHDHAIEAGGLTRYGRTGADGVRAPAEGYAEAFAEWALTDGNTTNPAALVYAERFKWRDRFGIDQRSEKRRNDSQAGKLDDRGAAQAGLGVPGSNEGVSQADSVATLADAPPLEPYQASRMGARFFGFNNESLETALARGPAKNLEELDDALLVELTSTSYLQSRMTALRAVDQEYAERSGKPNLHIFEQQMLEYLQTPQGVAKARKQDAMLAEEVSKLKDADALSRAAKALNGNQPELPADSTTYAEWDATKATRIWNGLLANKPLSEAEQKGLRYYSTSPGYVAMNRALRGNLSITPKDRVKAEEGIPQVRSALRPLPEPVLLTRLTGAGQFSAEGGTYKRLPDLVGLTGRTFNDKGFTSTAVSGGKLSSGDVLLEIEVPAGVPAAYMEKITRHKGEKEMLLSDGLEFSILRSEYDPVKKRVTMRVRVTDWPGKE